MDTFTYQLEDEFHAELLPGDFSSYEAAPQEVRRVAELPFGVPPNCPPCTRGKECERDYVIKKYVITAPGEWRFVEQTEIATATAAGVSWHVA